MRRTAVVLALLAAGIIGCSKTQDTAPEQRIFGTPPTMSSVDFVGEAISFACDATQSFEAFLGG